MTQQQFLEAYRSLPNEAKRQVAEFVAFLQQKYQPSQPGEQAFGENLESEPFIGMWQGHPQLEDSTAWVRSIRQKEWSNNS